MANRRVLREDRAASASWGRKFFLLDRLQALGNAAQGKGREMALKEVFGPAEADAMTRWKWRRKLLERMISAMEMARDEGRRSVTPPLIA